MADLPSKRQPGTAAGAEKRAVAGVRSASRADGDAPVHITEAMQAARREKKVDDY